MDGGSAPQDLTAGSILHEAMIKQAWRENGIVSYLSGGVLNRTELSRAAAIVAIGVALRETERHPGAPVQPDQPPGGLPRHQPAGL